VNARRTVSELRPNRHHLDRAAAARYLDLDEHTIAVLSTAGFLRPVETEPDECFAEADLKAFLARNADNGSGNLLTGGGGTADPDNLLRALDGRSDEMARRALDLFRVAFPDVATWSLGEQARFVGQARNRFEAILAVAGQGTMLDDALVGDVENVGAAAARAGSSLPQLLAILRISRDLLAETAIDIVEQDGYRSGLAVSLLLARVLPVVDRLTDALVHGYWSSGASRQS
jgi:hypothetical protein